MDEVICIECGNDLAQEGHYYCTECLESLFADSDPPVSGPRAHA